MDIYDLISIRVCIFFPVRVCNQYSFHLHCLLAVEIPNCTTPYFEGHRNQTYVVIIIYALDTQTNLKIHISEMGMIRTRQEIAFLKRPLDRTSIHSNKNKTLVSHFHKN